MKRTERIIMDRDKFNNLPQVLQDRDKVCVVIRGRTASTQWPLSFECLSDKYRVRR